jgi:multicomponent K+:H+ antiporter subunit A
VVGGDMPQYSLAVWHGFTAPLKMSLLAMAGGVLAYLLLRRSAARTRAQPVWRVFPDGKRMFEAFLATGTMLARRALRAAGTRRLQPQVLWLVVLSGLLATAALVVVPLQWGDRPRVAATPEFALLWVVGGACAVGAAWQAKFHRLAAVTMLAICGLVTSITFAWFSAPDLALTQLAVEVVTTVLFLLGLRWLPKRIEQDDPRTAGRGSWRRRRDFVLACFAGAGLAALSFAMLTRTAPQSISPFFLARALPDGGGANVVNVMLVDFRAFDTLGEITVLGIVGITVFALLRRFRPPREAIEKPDQQLAVTPGVATDLLHPRTGVESAEGYMTVPAVLVRLLLPIAGTMALYLFLRGHNEPGGGFVAGLVVAIAFIAQYMVSGTQWVEARMNLRPPLWIAWGLLVALTTGAGSIVLGYPFLTSHTAHFELPLVGEVHVPTALFFDIGVFAVVLGATLLALTALAHQSLRSRRRPRPPEPAAAPAEEAAAPAAAPAFEGVVEWKS